MRRSCETAAIRPRRACSSAASVRDHRVDVGAQAGELVAAGEVRAHVAAPVRDGVERRAHGVDVGERAAAEQASRPEAEHAGERGDEHGEERVVAGDEHELHEDADGDRQLRRGDDREQDELPAQAADLRAVRDDRVRREDGRDAERQEDEQRGARRRAAVGRAGQRRGDGGGRDGEREAAPHGENRYPTPQTVSMWRGRAGSGSIFVRSRRMWTVTVEVSV